MNGAFVKHRLGCVKCPIGAIRRGSSCIFRRLPDKTPIVRVVGNGAKANPNDQVTPAIVNKGDVQSICGNGLIESLEECDDRNTQDGDGCSSTCKI